MATADRGVVPTTDADVFAAAAHDVCRRSWSTDEVRAAWTDATASEVVHGWRALADLGLFSMLVPADRHGLGFGETELVAVFRELGRYAVPGPVLQSTVFAPLLADQDHEVLPGLLDGSRVITSDLGALGSIPHAAYATDVIVMEGPGGAPTVVHGVTGARLNGLDGSRWAVGSGEIRPGVRLDVPSHVVDIARHRGVLGVSAQLVGLGERIVQMSVSHACEREQFGVPIGAFQALQHQLVDAHKALVLAWPMVREAAETSGADSSIAASMAKVLSVRAAEQAAAVGLQVHGALGYTREHPLHLYLTRVWSTVTDFGSEDVHLERVESHLRERYGAG